MSIEVEKYDIDELLESSDEVVPGFNDKQNEFQIKYWSYARSVKELIEMYTSKEIIIPSLQREYVWTYDQACLFIDSVLRGLPIPSFFVTEIAGKYLMIDGLQRLHTLRSFYQNESFEGWGKGKEFRLSNRSSSISCNFRGKTFGELDEEHKNRFIRTMMSVIEFSQISPANNYSAMFQIFERINSTGRALTAQEVRNAAYYSDFNKELNDFGAGEPFSSLYKCKKDSARTEMALRFLAIDYLYRHKERVSEYSLNLKNVLNEFMAVAQMYEYKMEISADNLPHFYDLFDTGFDYSEQFGRLEKVVNEIKEKLGDDAFHNIKWPVKEGSEIERRRTLNPALAEEMMVAVAKIIDQGLAISQNAKGNMLELLKKESFQNLITAGTMRFAGICERVDLVFEALTK